MPSILLLVPSCLEVRHFIEHRARHDAMAMGGDLVRCIQADGERVFREFQSPTGAIMTSQPTTGLWFHFFLFSPRSLGK